MNSISTATHFQLRGFMADDYQANEMRRFSGSVENCQSEYASGGVEAAIAFCKVQHAPQLLVIDVGLRSDALEALDELAGYCAEDTKVVVTGNHTGIDFYQQLMNLGVSEYLTHPITADRFAQVIKFTMGLSTRNYQLQGKIVTFEGLRGGVGCSTLVANCAWHLSQQQRINTSVLDLDLRGGDIDLLLGARATEHLERLLCDQEQAQDNQLLARASEEINERLKVLKGRGSKATIDNTVLAARLQQLRQSSGRILLDTPRTEPEVGRWVQSQADIRVLVVDASLSSLRELNDWQSENRERYPNQRIIKVLNYTRPERHCLIKPLQFSEVLQGSLDHVLPWQPDKVSDALDLGVPLVSAKGKLASALAALSYDLMGQREPATKPWQKWREVLSVRS